MLHLVLEKSVCSSGSSTGNIGTKSNTYTSEKAIASLICGSRTAQTSSSVFGRNSLLLPATGMYYHDVNLRTEEWLVRKVHTWCYQTLDFTFFYFFQCCIELFSSAFNGIIKRSRFQSTQDGHSVWVWISDEAANGEYNVGNFRRFSLVWVPLYRH